jgi:hypothetical protein
MIAAPLEDDLDVKTFMDQHGIDFWATENDRIETALRMGGLKVLFVEASLDCDRWRLAVIRSEPDFFNADLETIVRLCALLSRNGIGFDPSEVRLRKASFRLEAEFTWAGGEPGRGVTYALAKRGRLIHHREEYVLNADRHVVAHRRTEESIR